MRPYPRVDDALAREVRAALGVGAGAPVIDVVAAFRTWLPGGSTAKWSHVDRGEIPPGADPATALEARLGGARDSWSCWPFCTGLGALLAADGHDVSILVEQRRQGGDLAEVDFHSVLVVDGALVDPYLGPTAVVPLGHDVAADDGWAAWVPAPAGSYRTDHLGATGGGTVWRYRELARDLDRRDIATFCRVSATHSGVGRRRTAQRRADGGLLYLRDGDGDDDAVVRRTEGDGPFALRRRIVDRGRWDDLFDRHFPVPTGRS